MRRANHSRLHGRPHATSARRPTGAAGRAVRVPGRVMKILVSAYACDPTRGSEPGAGWNWVRQAARFHDVWVITRAKNRRPIEDALREDPLPSVRWIYFDLPRWARFWKRG